MVEAIERFFLETVGRHWCVFFCSLLPIIELRGAIPLGAGLGLPLWQSYLISIVGNMLPVPFILLMIRWVLEMMKKVKGLSGIALWVEAKAEKNRPKIFAAMLITVMPVIIIFIIFQEKIMNYSFGGGIKG